MNRFEGVYIARSAKEDVLCTRNFAPGCTVYGEKKITVDLPVGGSCCESCIGFDGREDRVSSVESVPFEVGSRHSCWIVLWL